MRKIEVCCSSAAEIEEAVAGGAVRVELCGAIACGGMTPSYGVLMQARELREKIAVNVIIRPREGSFLYTADEVDAMCRDIDLCRELGLHGVVIGALTPEGDVDVAACRRMMEHAGGLSVTFHRAFDVCRSPFEALEQIIALGCDRLLTSGQEPTAEQGAALIAQLVERAAGRIVIMPGAGIRPSNIARVEEMTRATEFHSTARVREEDGMRYRNGRVSFAVSPSEEGMLSHSCRRVVSALVHEGL